MSIVNILRNVNVVVDGRGYAGRASTVQLPKLTVATDEHRAGGMDAPVAIDMGLEKLECGFTLTSVEPDLLASWGLGPGNLVPLTFRGALQSEGGEVTAAVATVRGMLREVDFGDWKPGEKAELKAMMDVRYYKLEIGGRELVEIDVDNMVRRVDGVDQLEAQRAALGV